MGNYTLYQIAIFITRILPLSFSYAVAVFLSYCQYLLSSADRRAVAENLKIITKSKHVPSVMVREVFHNFGKYLVDFFTMTKRVNKEYIKNKVQISGLEHLNKVLAYGKGGVIVSAHLGNWELAGAVLSLLGYPVSILALSHRDEKVNKFFNSQREFFGATVIQTNVAIRRCMEDLKRNRFIAILADRDFGHHGLKMDFLGRKTLMPKGAALFSLKTGAPIIPSFFLRGPGQKLEFVFQEPIYPPVLVKDQLISDEVLENYMSLYIKSIEEQIRRNPSQWLMFRRFDSV